jgi:hypothetical protein
MHRYSVIATADNSVYIFDKKSTMLNKCDTYGCAVINTNLPTNTPPQSRYAPPSSLFDGRRSMRDEIVKTNAMRAKRRNDDEEKFNSDANEDTKEDVNKKPIHSKSKKNISRNNKSRSKSKEKIMKKSVPKNGTTKHKAKDDDDDDDNDFVE